MAYTSWETLALETLTSTLALPPDITVARGMGVDNRFAVPSWKLRPMQSAQFGDLRLATARVTAVVEVESGGGVGNLVKYWPWLRERTDETRFVLAHAFRLTSRNDYIAHRRLWAFLVERMRDDLEPRGVHWQTHWEARIFSYSTGAVAEFAELEEYLKTVLLQPAAS